MATLDRIEKSRHLAQIVAQFRTAMLVNANLDGRHRARPMTLRHRDANEPTPAAAGGATSPPQVSFVTHRSNGLVDDLEVEPAVCATMQDGEKFVCLAGRARCGTGRSTSGSAPVPTIQ
jgi:general stress protein 26